MSMRIAVATALVASACMTGPYDQQTVANERDPIAFTGFHLQPAASVTVQARNWDTGRFETVEVVRSDARQLSSFDGHPLYPWSQDISLPPRFWEPGYRGARAQVRSLWSTSNEDRGALTAEEGAMLSVRRGWFHCSRDNDTIASFREHCAANDANLANLRTRNYCRLGPSPRVSSVRISESGGTKYKFSIGVSRSGDRVSRVFANGSWLDCQRASSTASYYVCESSYGGRHSQFSGGCDIEAWLEADGRVFVDASDSSSTCYGAATVTRTASASGGFFCPRPRPPASEPPARTDEICRSAPVPSGWIITDDFNDGTRCGRPTATDDYNVLEIVEYDALPRGATLDVCARSPVPSGWSEIRTFWAPNRCGHPTLGWTPNVRTIYRR